MSSEEGSVRSGRASRYQALTVENTPNLGPLSKLYTDKFAFQFLQYPLNLESPEQDHWVRFDIQKIQGVGLTTDASRDASSVAAKPGEEKTFLERATDFTAEKLAEAPGAAKNFAITQGTRQVSAAADVLSPALSGIGKKFINSATRVKGLGSIMLYAPQARSETSSYSWTPEAIEQLGALGAQAASGGFNGELLRQARGSAAPVVKEAITKGVSAALGGDAIRQVLHRKAGHVVNPHLEMFFKGIDMRTFTFEFKMAPRNAPEAAAIASIVRLFKFAAAPGLGSDIGYSLDYPEVFDISFSNQEQTHKIAQSALTSITVSYGADGVNTTFYDGYPVETLITLVFTELEIMHKAKILQGY